MPLGKQGAGLAPASLLSYLLPAGDVHPQPGTTSTRCIAVRPATVRHIGGVIVVGDGGSSAIALGPPEASAPYSNSGNKPHSMALHLPERSPAFLLPGCELYVYLQAERRKGRERKRQFPYLSFNGASYWAKVVSRGGLSRGSFANPRQGQLQNLVMRKTTKPDDFSFQVQGGKKKMLFLAGFLASSRHGMVQAPCSPSHQREQVPMPAVVCTSCPGSAGSPPSRCLQSKPVAVSPFPSLTLPLLFMYLFRLKTHITQKTVARETRC